MSVVSLAFTAVTVSTTDQITAIQGGSPLTPLVNWTLANLTLGAASDAIVDVGAPILVPVSAVYEHDHEKKIVGAVVVAKNATNVALGREADDAPGLVLCGSYRLRSEC